MMLLSLTIKNALETSCYANIGKHVRYPVCFIWYGSLMRDLDHSLLNIYIIYRSEYIFNLINFIN